MQKKSSVVESCYNTTMAFVAAASPTFGKNGATSGRRFGARGALPFALWPVACGWLVPRRFASWPLPGGPCRSVEASRSLDARFGLRLFERDETSLVACAHDGQTLWRINVGHWRHPL